MPSPGSALPIFSSLQVKALIALWVYVCDARAMCCCSHNLPTFDHFGWVCCAMISGVDVHSHFSRRKGVSHLWLELQGLPHQLHLLPAVVLLHHREAERELRHLQPPSPETRNSFEEFCRNQRECQQKMGSHQENTNSGMSQRAEDKFFWKGDNAPLDVGGLEGRGSRAEILLPAIKPNCLKRRKLREEQMEIFTKMFTAAAGVKKEAFSLICV